MERRLGDACSPLIAACSYAYGLVLWCLFSGRRYAWEDAFGVMPDIVTIADRVREGDRPDLSALRPDTPPAITALIQRCWAHNPADRPTAMIIARETESWLAVRSSMESG